MQRQTAVTAYFSTAYFSSKQLLLFAFARQYYGVILKSCYRLQRTVSGIATMTSAETGTGRKLRCKVRSVMRGLEGVLDELKTVMGDLKVLVTQIDAVVEKIDPDDSAQDPDAVKDAQKASVDGQSTVEKRAPTNAPHHKTFLSSPDVNLSRSGGDQKSSKDAPRSRSAIQDIYSIESYIDTCIDSPSLPSYRRPCMDTASARLLNKHTNSIHSYSKTSIPGRKTVPAPEYPVRDAYTAYSSTTLSSGYCEEIPAPNICWSTFLNGAATPARPALGVAAKVVGQRRKVGPRPASSIIGDDKVGECDHPTEDSSYFSHDSIDGLGVGKHLEVPRMGTSISSSSAYTTATPGTRVSTRGDDDIPTPETRTLLTPESGQHSCECQPSKQEYCGIYEDELDRRLESEYEDGSSLESSCCMDFVNRTSRSRRRALAEKRHALQQQQCLPSPSCRSAGFDEDFDSDDEYSGSSLESLSADQVYRKGFLPKTLSPNLVNYSWRIVIKP